MIKLLICKNTLYFRFHQLLGMVVFPNCKINIGLHILRKRTDGFHDIETCFYPVQWTDILEVNPSEKKTPFAYSSSGRSIYNHEANKAEISFKDNLLYKAYELVSKTHTINSAIELHLHKVLPMGAGLGGGSSDAAYFIKVLNHLFKLHLSAFEMRGMAAQLGSDCAFFIENKPVLAHGKGEKLENINLDLSGKYILIIHPNIHSDTKLAYQGVVPNENKTSLASLLQSDISDWKNTVVNDFEHSIGKAHPVILEIKETLYSLGARYAAMSGSGSAIYGIFDHQPIEIPKMWHVYSVYHGVL
jgi:4-diphosphocytidyl-2-C-methyl-D-erythritol kinase